MRHVLFICFKLLIQPNTDTERRILNQDPCLPCTPTSYPQATKTRGQTETPAFPIAPFSYADDRVPKDDQPRRATFRSSSPGLLPLSSDHTLSYTPHELDIPRTNSPAEPDEKRRWCFLNFSESPNQYSIRVCVCICARIVYVRAWSSDRDPTTEIFDI